MSAPIPRLPAMLTEAQVRAIVRDELAKIAGQISSGSVPADLQAAVDATTATYQQHLKMPEGGDQ